MDSTGSESTLFDEYYHIRNMTSLREIESEISNDRSFSAYALGHLEKELFEKSKFYLNGNESNQLDVITCTMSFLKSIKGIS